MTVAIVAAKAIDDLILNVSSFLQSVRDEWNVDWLHEVDYWLGSAVLSLSSAIAQCQLGNLTCIRLKHSTCNQDVTTDQAFAAQLFATKFNTHPLCQSLLP